MLCHLEKKVAREKKIHMFIITPQNSKLKAGMGEVSNKDRKREQLNKTLKHTHTQCSSSEEYKATFSIEKEGRGGGVSRGGLLF